MISIIQAIDNYTTSYFSGNTLKTWGFCELMHKSAGEGKVEQPMPVTITDRKQVSLLDNYQIITWIRQTQQIIYDGNEDWSFGKNEARFASLPLRIIFCNKVSLVDSEKLVYSFIHSFPSTFSIDGYRLVFTDTTPSIDPDHESIYREELGNTVYEKHRFPWNIYGVNITIQFIECD
jgi:hypothetical protein